MNESSWEIVEGFHVIGWDNKDWQISETSEGGAYDMDNIIIGHDVFAVGNNEDFIIVKQHPCPLVRMHLQHTDHDGPKPDKSVINYYLIDIRKYDKTYAIYSFDNETEFNRKCDLLGVPEDLEYQFYDEELE